MLACPQPRSSRRCCGASPSSRGTMKAGVLTKMAPAGVMAKRMAWASGSRLAIQRSYWRAVSLSSRATGVTF